MKQRVVVTGMGIVSPLGNTVAQNLEKLKSGQSGISHITKFDTTDYPVTIAGEVRELQAENIISRKELKRLDSYVIYGLVATDEAQKMAQIDFDKINRERVGVLLGSGIGGMEEFEEQSRILWTKGPRRVSPFLIPKLISNMAAGHAAMMYKIYGPNFSVVSACASGAHAIGNAMTLIREDECDIIIAGASEAAITRLGIAGFANMKAITSSYNDAPEKASRPFDAHRDGFVMGEGAGVLVLESLEHALQRKAPIIAELVSIGASADGYHITAPDPEGFGACLSMRKALKNAGIQPEEIDYINAHGTSTPFNDKIETLAIKKVFQEHAQKVSISSTKSLTGHLLGAAGAIESVFSLLSIQHQFIPPTINYENPDPDCDLNYTPNVAVEKKIGCVMSNSFGFGGQNATLIFKKYDN